MHKLRHFRNMAAMWRACLRNLTRSKQTCILEGHYPRRFLSIYPKTVCLSTYHRNSRPIDFRLTLVQARCMSGGQKNFLLQFIENIKQEMGKNKEMKDSLDKFRKEREKLEQSEALQKARSKYETIEAETAKGSAALKKTLDDMKDKFSEISEEIEKTDFAKKGKQITEEIGKSAEKAAESISKGSEQFGKTTTFRTISKSVKAIKEEFDETTMSRARPYKAPEILKKRVEHRENQEERHYEADDEATGVVLHKDSRWYQSWQNFKDNNQYVNKLFDLKMKYDESDNIAIRATRAFTDKIGYLFGGMFSKTEMSEVLTEICKIDANFDKEGFVKFCEIQVIPNVLEAMIRGELDILKDWCYEATFNTLAHPIKQAKAAGYIFDSTILDVSHVDVAAGKMMEQGPVLVISFSTQQIMVVRDSKGAVVEGDPEKILRVMYVWALCRDQEELNPKAAWKLIDISASSAEQWL